MMKLNDIARQHLPLVRIDAMIYDEIVKPIAGLILYFHGVPALYLFINQDEDSFVWEAMERPGLNRISLNDLIPAIGDALGLVLIWEWEMVNQQGYFDALQLELTDHALQKSIVLQFKVAASSIHVFQVSPVQQIAGTASAVA